MEVKTWVTFKVCYTLAIVDRRASYSSVNIVSFIQKKFRQEADRIRLDGGDMRNIAKQYLIASGTQEDTVRIQVQIPDAHQKCRHLRGGIPDGGQDLSQIAA
jgi:hypothetical protein